MVKAESGSQAEAAAAPVTKPRRALWLRLFGISLWGWVKLALLCVLVGFFVMAAEFDAGKSQVRVLDAVQGFLRSLGGLAQWAVVNFWKPALAGAGLVLPIWFLWRLVSLPFRK